MESISREAYCFPVNSLHKLENAAFVSHGLLQVWVYKVEIKRHFSPSWVFCSELEKFTNSCIVTPHDSTTQASHGLLALEK